MNILISSFLHLLIPSSPHPFISSSLHLLITFISLSDSPSHTNASWLRKWRGNGGDWRRTTLLDQRSLFCANAETWRNHEDGIHRPCTTHSFHPKIDKVYCCCRCPLSIPRCITIYQKTPGRSCPNERPTSSLQPSSTLASWSCNNCRIGCNRFFARHASPLFSPKDIWICPPF